jgi:TP901 family phage tail tape measure protein
MADVNANIGVNIDTSLALAQLKSLQRQISQFHTSIARSSETAALAQKSLQKNFLNSVNAIGSFSAELRTVKTTTESFTSSLEGNKFSMREYFRYAGGATKTFGRLFKSEFDTIGKVAEERVKRLQTQYIKMGRDASGAMQAISITPTALDMENYGTKTAIAAQKQALFNQLMRQGSTNLLNFGKNTQWAGRQLMVGFTIPLAMVGSAATKTFMDMEAQALKFKKVYGDLFTPKEETQQALENITELGRAFTKYGVAVSTTVGLAAEAAAAGFSGLDLQRQTTEATRLSILGQLDSQKALETTISLQNSFGMSSEKLADSINFLNAVENQTVVSLDDITTAIPKVAPVIQQLGGDVKDLTFFMAAMKEGGINASEGANALKSGLAALINPTGRASEMLAQFGINATEIVTKNKGNLKATVIEFATALNQLDPLNRAQAIEQMFGKFQFARLSTLFANVAKDGNQAARVLDLANSSVEELSALSEQELGMTADSAMNKFKKTVEDLKAALIPVGQAFLEAVTPIVEFVGNILEKFADLSSGTKKAITLMATVIGGLGPILLMTFGLLANGVANIIKLFLTLRNGYLRLTGQSQILGEQTQYLTMEQIDAAAASHSLNQAHANLTQQFTAEASAVNQLIVAYQNATKAGAAFAMNNPGAMRLPTKKFASGGIVSGAGGPTGDKIPIMASDGEAVIPAKTVNANRKIINDLLSTGTYKPRTDITGRPGNSARSGASYRGVMGLVAGRGLPGATIGVPGNMPAQSSERGQFKKVKIPGAMNMAHFGEKTMMSGQELLDMVEGLDTTLAQNIRDMVNGLTGIQDGLRRKFKVFDNQVVAQLDVINNAMDKDGKASMSLVKENLVGDVFAPVRDIELQRQLEAAAVPLEDIQKINQQLTDSMVEGFTELGDITEITSDQLDKLIRDAYEAVAKTDERVSQAYENMKQVTTVFEPGREGVRGKRIAVTKESYTEQGKKTKVNPKSTYRLAQERMVSPGQVPYPELSDFGINEKMIQGLGLTLEQAQAKFKDLSATVKVELSRLAGDTKEFSVALKNAIDEAEASGVALGQAAVKSISKGAKTASPSKDTIKTGEDVGKGLEIGMQSRKDEVAAIGSDLGKTATQSTSRGAKSAGPITPGQPFNIQKTQGGVTVGQVAAGAPISPDIKEKVVEQARVTQTATDRLRNLDRNIMGASFAISSLSGIASMSGGALGRMAGTISKVTGAMFALQAITGLLTQTKLLEHAATRANVVAQGMGAAGFKGLLVGVAGFGKKLLTIAKFLGRFAGPIGALITAVAGSISIFKALDGVRKREIEQITGLSNAMATTTEQVKTLGDFFGVVPSKLPFELGKGREIASPQARSQRESLKASAGFQQQFAQTIKTLSTATAAEAQLAFTSLALNLKAQGFATDQVQTIIDALREEAGKTDVVLDVKSLNLSQESIQKLQGQVAAVFIDFEKNVKVKPTGMEKFVSGFIGSILGEAPKLKEYTTITERSLNSITTFMSETAKSSAGMFQLGLIDAATYTNSLNGVIGMTKNLDEANKKLILTRVFESLNAGSGALLASLKSAQQQMMALALLSSGVLDKDSAILKGLTAKNALVRGRAVGQLTKKYNELTTAITKATSADQPKPYVPPKNTDTGPKKLTLADMIKKNQEFVKNIDNQNKALVKLTAAGMTVAEAMEIVTDAEMAAVIAGTDIKKSATEWNKYVKSIRAAERALLGTKEGAKEASDAASSAASSYFSAQEALIRSQRQAGEDLIRTNIETAQAGIDKVQSNIDKQQVLIDNNNDAIDKINRQIEIDYDRPIQLLNDEASILQNNLTLIDQQTEAINAKYDAQAEALNKISEINSEIASQQKQQLGLADALSRGDIAAAATAAQEMRAQAAASRVGGTQAALEAARTQQLAGVTSGGMTKEQIDQRLFIINQQTFALEQSRKTLQTEVVALQDKNYGYELEINKIKKDSLVPSQKLLDDANKSLEAYIKTTDQQISSLTYLGLTSKEWENNKIKVDAAYESISATETSLQNSKTAAKTIFDLWDSIKSKTITITTNYVSSGTPFGQAGSSGTTKKMYGGKIMPMNYGGMVPKYMAIGGKVGSDTVPAMLTPGEFVMNKAATKRFGPMLEGMNNSKYPSMIKDLTPTTYTNVNSSMVTPIVNNMSTTVSDNSSTMYNYNVGINVNESNASSNDIARAVIGQIKYIDSQRIRGQR